MFTIFLTSPLIHHYRPRSEKRNHASHLTGRDVRMMDIIIWNGVASVSSRIRQITYK